MSRWSRLYREFSDLPLHTGVWRGTRSEEEAELITDGTMIVSRAAVEQRDGSRLHRLPEREPGHSIVESRYVEKLWAEVIPAAAREVWPVWQSLGDDWAMEHLDGAMHRVPCRAYCIDMDVSPADYFDPREDHLDRTVCLDAIRARLICWLTHPKELRAQEDPRRAVVWYGDGLEPVAIQMPVRMPARQDPHELPSPS